MKKAFFVFLFLLLFSNFSRAQYIKIFDFPGSDGSLPYGSLIFDSTILYGVANQSIFKINPDGTGYTQLFNFSTAGALNGTSLQGSLYSDSTFLYGMANAGGVNDMGTIFKIKKNGTSFTKLLDFSGTANGSYSSSSFISDGTYLYSMTFDGGINAYGVVFKIKTDGTGYSKLLDFSGPDGASPSGSLVYDGTYLYGMTWQGGTAADGVLFKIKTDGTGDSVLLNFTGLNGSHPNGSLISDGTYLYGMTESGGTSVDGTIFKIKPDGTGYTKLLDFNSTNGSSPYGSLFYDGIFLYGLTQSGGLNNKGVLFKIKTDGTGYTNMFDFAGTNGSTPFGSLISDSSFLYGMANVGGSYNDGVIFKYALFAGAGVSQIQDLSAQISISPNPSSAIFQLTNAKKDKIYFKINNIIGEEVLSERETEDEETKVDLSGKPKGVYFIQIIDKNKNVANKKIIVQ